MLTSFFGAAGGGESGKGDGIVHNIMIVAGVITGVSQVSILTWTQAGGRIIEIMIGTGIGGTMNGSLINDFIRTGVAGIRADIGKGKELGVYRVINPDYNAR